MSPTPQSVVSEAFGTLEHIEVPAVLQDRIDQHQRNLLALAASLLAGGQDTDQVRETIEGVLDSFKHELLNTIKSLRETDHVV